MRGELRNFPVDWGARVLGTDFLMKHIFVSNILNLIPYHSEATIRLTLVKDLVAGPIWFRPRVTWTKASAKCLRTWIRARAAEGDRLPCRSALLMQGGQQAPSTETHYYP